MNDNSLMSDKIANLLVAYIEKSSELAMLEAKVSLMRSQIKDDRDLIFGRDLAAIFGWTDLPKREEKREEV